MNCPKCGAEVVADAVFCQKCGTRLAGASVAPPNDISAPRGRGVTDTPEVTLWEGRFSPKAMVGTWIGVGLACAAFSAGSLYMVFSKVGYAWIPLMLAVLALIVTAGRFIYTRFNTRYKLTNHRFFHEEGIFSLKVNPIDLITITDVSFEQGFVERIMGVGDIKIMSNDTTDRELLIEGVENVQDVLTLIDKTRREETMRRRVFFSAGQDADHPHQ